MTKVEAKKTVLLALGASTATVALREFGKGSAPKITLPIGVETYAAFALRVWMSPRVPRTARREP